MNSDSTQIRLGVLGIAALSLFGALFARLWFLQIVSADDYQALVNRTSTKVVTVPAPRGRILDRNGIALVSSRSSVVVTVDTQQFDKMEPEQQNRLLDRLATEISASRPKGPRSTVKSLRQRLNDQRFSHLQPVPVASDVPESLEILLKERADEFPAVEAERLTVRSYPYGRLAAHVLGYVGALSDEQWAYLRDHNLDAKPYGQADSIGKAGAEATFETSLRGTPGRIVYEVDARGRPVRELTSQRIEPKPGDDVYLSIDAKVQVKTEEALQASLIRAQGTKDQYGYRQNAKAGAMVVLDPSNGQVLSMASYPNYDPSTLVDGISNAEWKALNDPKAKALTNRAIQGAYPAASTFKLATSYAGLKLGMIAPDTKINDPGYYEIPGCTAGEDLCRKKSPAAHGTVDLARSLTVSSDVYYYTLGNNIWARHKQGQLPADAMQQQIAALGYGQKTGIDLPGESAGRLPTPDWLMKFSKQLNKGNPEQAVERGTWRAGDNINLAIGQGDLLATPLQTATAYATFANGGTMYRPSILSKITEYRQPDKVLKAYEPVVIRHVDWGDARPAVLAGLQGVTTPGSGGTASLVFEGYNHAVLEVAGKTGTAQTGNNPATGAPNAENSLFVGFAPIINPRYVASAMLEGAGSGAEAAAPAVRMVFDPIANNQLPAVDLKTEAFFDPAQVAASSTVPLGAPGTD